MFNRKYLPMAALLFAGLACNFGGGPSQIVVVTATSAPAQPATDMSTPAAATASAVPTATAASAPPTGGGSEDRGEEAILILEPGVASSVTSPVRVAGLADPTFEQTLVVQITNADGAVIATTPTTIHADVGQRGPFAVDVSFSLGSDQPGRISVFHVSARDGGLIHLASVEVTLLAGGAASINPAQPHKESIAILAPQPQATIGSGALHLAGFSEYVFENVLNAALCGAGGSGPADLLCGTTDNVIASGIATVHSPDMGQPGPFDGDLAFSVTSGFTARLIVYSISPRDGGITHLSSVDVNVTP